MYGVAIARRPRLPGCLWEYDLKPFHYPELLARIAALLKRVSRVANRDQLRIGDLVVVILGD